MTEELKKILYEAVESLRRNEVTMEEPYDYPFAVVDKKMFKKMKHNGELVRKTPDHKYWIWDDGYFPRFVIGVVSKKSKWREKKELVNTNKFRESFTPYLKMYSIDEAYSSEVKE